MIFVCGTLRSMSSGLSVCARDFIAGHVAHGQTQIDARRHLRRQTPRILAAVGQRAGTDGVPRSILLLGPFEGDGIVRQVAVLRFPGQDKRIGLAGVGLGTKHLRLGSGGVQFDEYFRGVAGFGRRRRQAGFAFDGHDETVDGGLGRQLHAHRAGHRIGSVDVGTLRQIDGQLARHFFPTNALVERDINVGVAQTGGTDLGDGEIEADLARFDDLHGGGSGRRSRAIRNSGDGFRNPSASLRPRRQRRIGHAVHRTLTKRCGNRWPAGQLIGLARRLRLRGGDEIDRRCPRGLHRSAERRGSRGGDHDHVFAHILRLVLCPHTNANLAALTLSTGVKFLVSFQRGRQVYVRPFDTFRNSAGVIVQAQRTRIRVQIRNRPADANVAVRHPFRHHFHLRRSGVHHNGHARLDAAGLVGNRSAVAIHLLNDEPIKTIAGSAKSKHFLFPRPFRLAWHPRISLVRRVEEDELLNVV